MSKLLGFRIEGIGFSRRKIASRFFSNSRPISLEPRTCNLKPNAGFSLIELLVSMSLFIVVLTIAIGALLSLISANAKAQNIHGAVSNVQFALDGMSREIRTGSSYYCTSGTETSGGTDVVLDCNKGTYLSIIEGGSSLTSGANNKRLAYRYNSGAGSIERKIGTGSWVRLTDPNVTINAMHFNVMNSVSKINGNSLQPNVTIYISGQVSGVSETATEFNIQTTVVDRTLDL